MGPAEVAALAGKVTAGLASAVGRSLVDRLRNPEGSAVSAAVKEALVAAFTSAQREDLDADEQWMADVATLLVPSFTPAVSRALLLALGDVGGEAESLLKNR